MKILYRSDMPHVTSGYGTQTRWLLPELVKLGHDVKGFAKAGLNHGISRVENIVWFPTSGDVGGNDMVKANFDYTGAELLISLSDAWVHDPDIYSEIPALIWYPVDHEPIPPGVIHSLKGFRWRAAFSLAGQKQAIAHDLPSDFVPLMIPTDEFIPKNRAACRQEMGVPMDAFMIGIVGVNVGGLPSRKAWEHQLRGVGAWHARHPEIPLALYLHTDIHGLSNGIPLQMVLDVHNLKDCVYTVPPYEYANGLLGTAQMATMYSALDVLVNCSMGEGCGLPIIEAQSCGTPVVVTDFSAMPEHVYAGWKVEVNDHIWTFQNSYMALPGMESMLEALDAAYAARGDMALREQARAGAVAHHAIEHVVQTYWKPLLERIESELAEDRHQQAQTVSAVTLWKDHPELISAYEAAMQEVDQVVIVDNGSTSENAKLIHAMVERLRGVYIRNGHNNFFASGNNQGAKHATGDIVLFVNNDVQGQSSWVRAVRMDVKPGALYGAQSGVKQVEGKDYPYLPGWCVAATRATWDDLGGWDESFVNGYWEDCELSYRAARRGMGLKACHWQLQHLGGVTTARPLGDGTQLPNYQRFVDIVKANGHVTEAVPEVV